MKIKSVVGLAFIAIASVLLPSLQPALAIEPDYPCFMRAASGRVIDLTSMCKGQQSTAAAIESPKSINISMAQYNQIKKSMTYDQVTQIFKSPGLRLFESDTAMGFKSSRYHWENLDGSFAGVDFNGGMMTSKIQKDLK